MIGVGPLAVASTARVRASAMPVRGRPCHFWNATIAVCVAGPVLAVDVRRGEVAERGKLLLQRARAAGDGPAGRRDRRVAGTFGVASDVRVSGTVASTPGKSPSGVPPLIRSRTERDAGNRRHGAHELVEPRERGVGRGALQEADAEIDGRDVPFSVTLRTRVPAGT